jgi:hypothetical protein
MATADPASLSFGEQHFGSVDLGHKTRNACLIRVANRLVRHPGGTLPDKLSAPKDYKALGRLVNRPEAEHARILQPHFDQTRRRIAATVGTVLDIHDTTELDYSGLKSIQDLGPIGNGHNRGFLCHNSLAVDPGRREVLGLVHQILHRRVPVPPKEGVKDKRERKTRESRLWTDAVEAIGGADPQGPRVVDVCDRGADIFEFLATEDDLGRCYLVRAFADRRVALGHEDQTDQRLLYGYARSLVRQGQRKLEIHGRDGAADRSATVAVAWAPIQVLPPHVKRGLYQKRPLQAWLVHVREVDAPVGVEPAEWFLLTNVPVTNVAEAWERADWYACRWMIEEYHKGQKTGCAIEDLQFTTSHALQAMIAILSVVAVTLLNLRAASRAPDAAARPAPEVVAREYVEVLSAWRYRGAARALTVREFFLALARLGGHQNRPSDKRPGWLVLWRGWMKLQHMVDGAEAVGYICGSQAAPYQGQNGPQERGAS